MKEWEGLNRGDVIGINGGEVKVISIYYKLK